MLTIIQLYFTKLKPKSKIFIIVLFISIIVGISFASKYAYFKYKYYKQIEKELVQLKQERNQTEVIETKIISKAKKRTISVQKKVKEIDKKLKQDEKNINNSTVTDAEINDFITKHQ